MSLMQIVIAVVLAFTGMVLLQADVTANNADHAALLKRAMRWRTLSSTVRGMRIASSGLRSHAAPVWKISPAATSDFSTSSTMNGLPSLSS